MQHAAVGGPEALPRTLSKPSSQCHLWFPAMASQRRLLYLLLLQSSPGGQSESPLVCLQTAGSKQMQGLFANCHGPGLLQRPARWVQLCGFKSHLPQADSWVEPLSPSQSTTSCFAVGKIKSNATEEPKQRIGLC